jgi:hypothetical protein
MKQIIFYDMYFINLKTLKICKKSRLVCLLLIIETLITNEMNFIEKNEKYFLVEF